jgi:hypothetical protein
MQRFIARLTVLAMAAASGAAVAQSPPQMVKGKVVAVDATSVTVATDSGNTKIMLAPDWAISVSAPITIDQIQPGSKIGTTNVDVPGGGKAVEVHVFPPGVPAFEGQRTMDAKTGSKMTNGTVGNVVSSANGRELDVSFPGGTRHVQVPANAQITSTAPADRSMLKTGISVTVSVMQEEGKPAMARFVMTGPGGSPPAR